MKTAHRPHASHWLRPPGPVADGMKIGLLGGSFNPAHEGHLHVSLVALKRLGLDYVWWLVAPHNPLKSVAGMAPRENRFVTARETANHPRILVVDAEHTLSTRYTIDTLAALKKRFATVNFVWLMGSDNLEGFHRWRRWQDIARLVPIAVVQRPGHLMAALNARPVHRFPGCFHEPCSQFACREAPAFTLIDGRRNATSATAIRAQADRDAAMAGAPAPW
jgi:nicotinate-nucleotide adenylyltransferase